MNSAKEKWLIPVENLLVRDPRTKAPLPVVGVLKPWIGPEGRYWRRRVKWGEVMIGNPPAKSKIEKAEDKKSKKGGNK